MAPSDDLLPYSTLDLITGPTDTSLGVMCSGVRLYISFNLNHFPKSQHGAAEIVQQFARFRTTIDQEPGAMEDFEDWMVRPCIRHIRHLAVRKPRANAVSLHDYFHPETLIFQLVNVEGRLDAKLMPDNPSETTHLKPRVALSDTTVSSAVQRGVACVPASQLEVIRAADVSDWDRDAMPELVQRGGPKGELLHFKAGFDKKSLTRELDTLLRIADLKTELPTTRLAGLVQWENERSIAGMLLVHIAGSRTMDCAAEGATQNGRARWMREIRDTVARLHDARVVWGDVKPQNVLIDARGSAWVVDFGGGFSPTWVDRRLEDTVEGDLQALARMETFLGV